MNEPDASSSMGNAEVLLVRSDGALVLQQRDQKPGISNPGLVTTFGGHIEFGETPLQAAVREINEETNLNLTADQLTFFGKYHKTLVKHGEDWVVYYFIAQGIDDTGLIVREGSGYVVAHGLEGVQTLKTSTLFGQFIRDYFGR